MILVGEKRCSTHGGATCDHENAIALFAPFPFRTLRQHHLGTVLDMEFFFSNQMIKIKM